MNKIVKTLFMALTAATVGGALADAGNTLIMFSTQADTYADGTPVATGEWYALCWSADETFKGVTSECKATGSDDKVLLVAPLAQQKTVEGATVGYCPTTLFQIDSAEAPKDGYYFVYLLDTRDGSGVPAGKTAEGLPKLVNGSTVALDKTAAATSVEERSGTIKLGTGQTTVAANFVESDIGDIKTTARIKGIEVLDATVKITVTGMHPSLRYNILSGPDIDNISNLPVPAQVSESETADVPFVIQKKDARFFKVVRQPLKVDAE